MNRYDFTINVNVPAFRSVEAKTMEEAIRIAKDRLMYDLYHAVNIDTDCCEMEIKDAVENDGEMIFFD